MIHVLLCDGPGGLRAGGAELLDEPVPEGGSVWIDIEAPRRSHEEQLIAWGYHPLAVEDTFTLHHQPKIEDYGDTLFAIVRGLDFNEKKDAPADELRTLKLAAFLSRQRLVTVHRAPLRSVEVVRRKLVEGGRAFPGGTAQILWSICDEMIDLYFPIVDAIGSEIERLEAEVFERPSQDQLGRVLTLRRQLSTLRRNMLPHRAVFQHLSSSRSTALDDSAALNFRDTLDNVLRLADAIDQQRDLLSNVKDTYLSVVAQRTNEVMRVLTVFSAIVLPLGLIAGIYGMNFQHMPELAWPWGYFAVLGLMATLAAGMLAWFRHKGWL
ncbi:MAG TPA: magnesium/cobalt transporter CorA [Thermoanaerobaculia bacterium]|nr:magnesium/cobalt transporter CorA [Thermoanaerobaculia bacterium]